MPSPAPIKPSIDLYHYQGQVTWRLVEEGVSIAFENATEGTSFVDPQFNINWVGIKDAGVRGALATPSALPKRWIPKFTISSKELATLEIMKVTRGSVTSV